MEVGCETGALRRPCFCIPTTQLVSPSGAAQTLCSIRQPPVHSPTGPNNVHHITPHIQLPTTTHLSTYQASAYPFVQTIPMYAPLTHGPTYLPIYLSSTHHPPDQPPIHPLSAHSSTQCASTHVLIALSTPAYSSMHPSTLPPTYHLFIFPLSPFISHPNTHPLSHSSLHHLHIHPPIMHPFTSRSSTPIYPPCPSLIPLSIHKLD